MVNQGMMAPDNLLLGTSSWSCSDWLGSFYPINLKPRQFIEAYARKFRAVAWIQELKKIVHKGVKTYAFFNNHYAGFAPGSVRQFEDLWEKSS